MAFPISKEVNGEKKDMGEACFFCVKGEDGKVQLKTLSRLDKPQYDLPAYKGVFTDEEKQSLKDTGTWGNQGDEGYPYGNSLQLLCIFP